MKPSSQFLLDAVARLYAPLMALFALSLLATRGAGSGVGLAAGLAFSLVFVLQALIYGTDAARAAAPPVLMRLFVIAGVCLSLAGAGLPQWAIAPQLIEAGAFAASAAGLSLVVLVIMGRAATLSEGDW